MKNFLIRTLSGFIYVILTLGAIAAGPLYFGILMFVFLILGLSELERIIKAEGFHIIRWIFYLPAILVYLIIFYWSINKEVYLFIGLLGLLHILFIYQLFSSGKVPVFSKVGILILPVIYLALPLSLLGYTYYLPAGMSQTTVEVVAGFFIIIWLNDTFAYLTGRLFGKNKMFESVSPNKTWEGSIGGLLFGLGGAWLMSLFSIDLNAVQWMGLALITIIFGTFGDLFESLLKRKAGFKDSGNIIPGHGGILDRLDSILLSAPFVFLYLYMIA